MNIDKFNDAISACRFCFMCRHLSAVGQVSGREADTPRGRALIADVAKRGLDGFNADYVDAIYRSDLSGANRFHCDGYHDGKGYDEIGIQLALREDLVKAGLAPEKVKKLAAELLASAKWKATGKGELLYFIDPATAARPTEVAAVEKVLKKAKIPCMVAKGGCIGKALKVLGFSKEAKAAMKKFADFVASTGVKSVLVSNPAAADALKNDFAAAGVKFPAEVIATFGYFAKLAADGKIKFAGKFGKASYLPSDYLKNYLKCGCAEKLLKLFGVKNQMFGTNVEESFSAGEGALVLNELNPELVKQLAAKIVAEADAKVPVLVASAYTANVLGANGLKVRTLAEVAGEQVC